ncbi:MAG: hypothetical protein JXX14_22465, partial [Deltaproteobacteria bacterium]|nr:hypothetical protein [Deltaproteobacteria bacterium]
GSPPSRGRRDDVAEFISGRLIYRQSLKLGMTALINLLCTFATPNQVGNDEMLLMAVISA